MKSILFISLCFIAMQCSSPQDYSDLPEVSYQSSSELLALSPNQEHLFVLDKTNSARLVSLQNGHRIIPLVGHEKAITNAIFSLDGTQVVTTSLDQTARLWSIPKRNDPLKPSLVLQGHQGAVLTAAFWPDGKKLATTSADGTIRIWDTMTGQQKLILQGHEGSVLSVAISPTGTTVVSGGKDQKLMLWDGETGHLKISNGKHTSPVQSIQFRSQPFVSNSSVKTDLILSRGLAGETFLWTYDQNHLNFLDSLKDESSSPVNMKLAQLISATDTYFGISSLSNSIVLGISQKENGTIKAWKVSQDKTNDHISVSPPTLVLQQPDSIESFTFWDGYIENLKYITTLDSSGVVRVFYGAAILENQALTKEDFITQISEKASLAQFLNPNQLLTATVSQGAMVWQVGSMPPPRDIPIQPDGTYSYKMSIKKYSPDGKQFIVGSGFSSGPVGSDLFSPVYLFDTQTGQKTGRLLHKNCIVLDAVDYHPTDNNLVLTSCDNHVYLWRINQPGKSELSTGNKEFEQDFVQSTSVQAARFCPDGSCVIAYLNSDRTVVWDIHSSTKPMSVIDSYFAGLWDGCVNPQSGVLMGRKNPNGMYPVHINFVFSTNSYLNDGLLSLDDKMNWVLNVDSDYRKQPALVCETQFSTDETRFVTRDAKGSVRVMSQVDNHVISEMKHQTNMGEPAVPNMALSTNGKWLATITPDRKAVKIWNTDTGQLLATIWGSPQFVTFIPNTDEFSISESDFHTLSWKVSALSSATSLQTRISF